MDLHCGAVPPALLESELFGHVKGAFTGAIQERAGKFQLADRGTLFLDEINTLPLEMQVKLVKAIEEQRFFPVGSDLAVEVEVRIIAASQEPLRLLVSQKRFREDLYHRLNVVAISIPPLRERRTDIPLLAHALLRRFNHKYHLRKTLSSSALNTLMQASWSGNVRALANAIENTMLFAPQSEIQAKDIPKEALLDRDRCIPSEPVQGNSGSSNAIETWVTERLSQDDCDVLRELQQMVLRVAWKQYQGNKTSIAKRLGISRGTLYSLLREFEADG